MEYTVDEVYGLSRNIPLNYKGFLIWLSMQDRNELLSTVGLPEMT